MTIAISRICVIIVFALTRYGMKKPFFLFAATRGCSDENYKKERGGS